MTLLMHKSPRLPTVAPLSGPTAPASLPAAFSEQLSNLYASTQRSRFVFGSPLGPFSVSGRSYQLPRFVYFGPNTTDAALRLSFLAGFDHRDLRPTLALLRLTQALAETPDLGEGLNLSFFPLVDLLGLAGQRAQPQLAAEHWGRTREPELRLLEKDARSRAYHGFVRLESALADAAVTIQLRSVAPLENIAPSLELISSEDVSPFAVRWETDPATVAPAGPLSIAA